MLEAIGISALEERVYATVLQQPGLPAARLTDAAGVSPSSLRRALSRLESLHLVKRLPGRAGGFVPTAPDAAIQALVHQRQAELAAVALATEELAAAYREGALRFDPGRLVEVVSDRETVVERFIALQRGATREVMIVDSPPYAVGEDSDELETERRLLRRGVHCRAVYSAAAIRVPGRLAAVRRLLALGERARVLPEVPIKVAITDRRCAVLPLTTTEAATIDSALIVYPSALLDALVALFESLWAQGTPLLANGGTARTSGELSAEEEEVLALLTSGLKDEAIARHLGVSLRTARRRITHLLRRLGAATRFQAGLQAAKRGWL